MYCCTFWDIYLAITAKWISTSINSRGIFIFCKIKSFTVSTKVVSCICSSIKYVKLLLSSVKK